MSHEEDGFSDFDGSFSSQGASCETTDAPRAGLDLRQAGVVEDLITSGMQVSFIDYQLGSTAKGKPMEHRVVCLVGPIGALVGYEGEGAYGFYNPDGTRIGSGQQQWNLTVEEANAISQRANPSPLPPAS